jgi:predicted alpha/beta-fold hydrolase
MRASPAPIAAYPAYRPLLRNGDLQSIIARYWPTPFLEGQWLCEEKYFQTSPDVKVLAHLDTRPDGKPNGTIVAVHGLTASSQAPYMLHLAQAALEAGMSVVRLNVRNCGGTEHLAPTLYHSGLTEDLHSVVEQLAPRPLVLAGFSMGGNMVLKAAGEWGGQPPSHVKGVCGVSVPIRLGECSRHLGTSRNRFYELRFLRELRRMVRLKQRIMPERFSSLLPDRAGSIYEFDDQVTAPAFGFRDADDYYDQSSSFRFLGHIRVPALLIQAEDDPFIPFQVFDDPVFTQNPFLQLVALQHGGHVGFLAKQAPRFWAQHLVARFAKELLNAGQPDMSSSRE